MHSVRAKVKMIIFCHHFSTNQRNPWIGVIAIIFSSHKEEIANGKKKKKTHTAEYKMSEKLRHKTVPVYCQSVD